MTCYRSLIYPELFASAMPISTTIKVISLPSDVERRTRFAERAAESPVAWSFFDAHREVSSSLVYDAGLTASRRGRLLSKGELGCYSSHYGTWEAFLLSDAQQLVVIEDDAWVDWDYLSLICEQDLANIDIHYLKLSCTNLPPSILKGKLLGRYVAHFLGYPQGAVGYVLTREGARKLIDHCRVIAGPIDIVMDQTWWGGMPALCLFPCPVVEKTGTSRIGAERYSEGGGLPAEYRLRRQVMRVQEKLRITAYKLLARCGFVGPRPKLDRRWM